MYTVVFVILFCRYTAMGVIKNAFFPTPYSMYSLLGIYLALCIAYVLIGIHLLSSKTLLVKLAKMILKGSPIVLLMGYFLYSVNSIHMGPVQAAGERDDLERIFFGLLFSFLGDCYLVFDSFFILGLLSFACSQFIYVVLFGGKILLFIMPSWTGFMAAVAVGLVSLWVYCYVYPKLSRVLVVAAALYCILISLMLWCALVMLMQDNRLATLQGAIGACLFYTSDLLLAVNRWGKDIPYGSYLVIATYYAAQVFIFLSVINRF
jgi:hypothetical protein